MTNLQKKQIQQAMISLNEKYGEKKGAYAEIATKCKFSPSLVTQMVNGNWVSIKDEKWQRVADLFNLDFAPPSETWQLAETINYKKVAKVCSDAKNYTLFQIISDNAGAGKTAPLKSYQEKNSDNAVFYIRCREWAKREFLTELCAVLGINIGKEYLHIDKLGLKVTEFFYNKSEEKPQLIVDEADKLKDSGLRWFIHLFNECEDKMSLILAGTPHLKQRIERGVKLKKLGFDELNSRFGRSFIGLIGATYNCLKLICDANGISEVAVQSNIWKELRPVNKEITIKGAVGQKESRQMVEVVEDLRRLKRLVIKQKLETELL